MLQRVDARLEGLTEWLTAWSRWNREQVSREAELSAARAAIRRRRLLVAAMVLAFLPILAWLVLSR